MKTISYLYVIAMEGHDFVKIGVSTLPEDRISNLQSGNPCRLYIAWKVPVGAEFGFQVERLAHKHLADRRACGEWFSVDAKTAHRVLQDCIDPKDGELFSKELLDRFIFVYKNNLFRLKDATLPQHLHLRDMQLADMRAESLGAEETFERWEQRREVIIPILQENPNLTTSQALQLSESPA